jgi:hypothetical protein
MVVAKETCQATFSFLCYFTLHHLMLPWPYLIFSVYGGRKSPNMLSSSVHLNTLSSDSSLPGMPIFHLPEEVRRIVYTFYFENPKLFYPSFFDAPVYEYINRTIILTNSHVKEEAEDVLYANTRLVLFDNNPPRHDLWPGKFLQLVRCMEYGRAGSWARFEFMTDLRVLDIHARKWSRPPVMSQDTLLASARSYIRGNIWHRS